MSIVEEEEMDEDLDIALALLTKSQNPEVNCLANILFY